ncbi:hypothetical protein TNCV_4437681 [Trichonephila clavipes]|nr:hypothetical protein TNCV_4437681 [Trichonephila clavipes]
MAPGSRYLSGNTCRHTAGHHGHTAGHHGHTAGHHGHTAGHHGHTAGLSRCHRSIPCIVGKGTPYHHTSSESGVSL